MENLANLNILEQKITTNIDLIEIAKKYCEAERENSKAAGLLYTLINIIVENQYELLDIIDKSFT